MLDRIKAHLARGEFVAAKRLVSSLLVTDLPPGQKAEIAVLGCKAAMALKEAFVAATMAQKALGYAQEAELPEVEGRAIFALAAAKLAVGDYAEARLHIRTFIDGMHDQWPQLDEELTGRAYANLGMALRNQRLYPDALQAYWQAKARFERVGDAPSQIKLCQEMAWTLILMGDLAAAGERLAEVDQFPELPPSLSSHQLTHEALLALHKGEHSKAIQKAEEILQPERPATSAGNKALASYVLAEVAYRTGQYEPARAVAESARDYALTDGLSSLLNMVNNLIHRIESAKQRASDERAD